MQVDVQQIEITAQKITAAGARIEAVELDTLDLDSPALVELRAAGVELVVPLVSRGGRP